MDKGRRLFCLRVDALTWGLSRRACGRPGGGALSSPSVSPDNESTHRVTGDQAIGLQFATWFVTTVHTFNGILMSVSALAVFFFCDGLACLSARCDLAFGISSLCSLCSLWVWER